MAILDKEKIMTNFNGERKGCLDVFKSYLVAEAFYEGEPEIPKLRATDEVPKKLIPFSQAVSSKDYDCWVHFYEDDCKFERIWNNPTRYLKILSRFEGVITPDFSVYRDMPKVMQEWNIYRSRAFAFALQRQGTNVIVNIRFGDARTYETACLGVPENASIAFGTHGIMKDREDRDIFREGLEFAVLKLKPKTIIVYGTTPSEIFEIYKQENIEILRFESMFAKKHRKEN